MTEVHCPGDAWACLPMGSSIQISCCALVLLYLLSYLYLKPYVFSLLPLMMVSPSHQEGVTRQLCGAELPDGVKAQQMGAPWARAVPGEGSEKGASPWPTDQAPSLGCDCRGQWALAEQFSVGAPPQKLTAGLWGKALPWGLGHCPWRLAGMCPHATPSWVIFFLLAVPQWSYGPLGGAAQSAGSPWAPCQSVNVCFGPLSLSMQCQYAQQTQETHNLLNTMGHIMLTLGVCWFWPLVLVVIKVCLILVLEWSCFHTPLWHPCDSAL